MKIWYCYYSRMTTIWGWCLLHKAVLKVWQLFSILLLFMYWPYHAHAHHTLVHTNTHTHTHTTLHTHTLHTHYTLHTHTQINMHTTHTHTNQHAHYTHTHTHTQINMQTTHILYQFWTIIFCTASRACIRTSELLCTTSFITTSFPFSCSITLKQIHNKEIVKTI